MTVTYNADVATVHGLGCFLKLLARWRGSIYKLVWIDLVMFLFIYYSLNIIYRWILDESGKVVFEAIVNYCDDYANLIPLSFVLGFYVSIVMTRWWTQYRTIPSPDPLAVFVSATLHGQDERGRVMRRTIMRYVCLSVTMVFTMISPRVKKRFPTLDHLVEAGLLQQSEKDIIADLNVKFPKNPKHWLPLVWASSIVTRARKEGRIRDDFAVKTIIDELNKFRGQCGLLLAYDHINIPLVYTQVSYLIVDEMHHEHPELVRDQYWDEVFPQELPYPAGSESLRDAHPLPSTANICVTPEGITGPSSLKIEDNMQSYPGLYGGPITFSARPRPQSFRSRGSQISLGTSVPDSMSRHNSVTNVLKRFFSRDDSKQEPKPDTNEMNNLIIGSESVPKPAGSIRKLTNQVIEEVDEQATITSQRSANESRPTVMNFFGPPTPSTPINVPQSHSFHNTETDVYEPFPRLSTSAPGTSDSVNNQDATDKVSIGGSVTDEEDDAFSRLKRMREEERLSRLKLNLSRSLINKTDESELLLKRRSSNLTSPLTPQSPNVMNV